MTSRLIKHHVLGHSAQSGRLKSKQRTRASRARPSVPTLTDAPTGNSDQTTSLKLNTTHVTPKIADLSFGLVDEALEVVGARLPSTRRDVWQANAEKRNARVNRLIMQARISRPRARWRDVDKVKLGSQYLKKVTVEKAVYAVSWPILSSVFLLMQGIGWRCCPRAVKACILGWKVCKHSI